MAAHDAAHAHARAASAWSRLPAGSLVRAASYSNFTAYDALLVALGNDSRGFVIATSPVLDGTRKEHVKAAAKAKHERSVKAGHLFPPIAIIKVAGAFHREGAVKAAVNAKGEVLVADRWTTAHTVELRREPDNEYDPNAIAIDVSGHHVGYIPARNNVGFPVDLQAGAFRVWELRGGSGRLTQRSHCSIAMMSPEYCATL